MKKLLVTGATGNVGIEVIRSLRAANSKVEIFAGVRNLQKDVLELAIFNIQTVLFDFNNSATFRPALKMADILFLLRPPQIADVKGVFKPLIDLAKETGIQHIVFLSVQGVEKNALIPHHKIEKLIVASGIPFTFLRPAYFMQNFTTTLRNDLVLKKLIYLPAGRALFTLVDVRDIGRVTASVLLSSEKHINVSYELTAREKYSFFEMAQILSKILQTKIAYHSPTLLRFFLVKRKEKQPWALILVMIMLHYLPRFQREPLNSNFIEKITGHLPISFARFVQEHKDFLTQLPVINSVLSPHSGS